MNYEIDKYEAELVIETLSYRLENDEELILSELRREEIEDLLRKLEDEIV